MPATLRDVAERANVSTSTVSRILNNKGTSIPISEETRQRVLQAVQTVGYKPNIAARQLARQQTFALICAVVPFTVPTVLSNPFYMSVVRGIARACQPQGYAVTIYFADTNNLDARKVMQDYGRILEIPADGIILTTIHANDQFVPRLITDAVPFVHIGRLPDAAVLNSHYVDVDNYTGAQLATSHLINKGHRRIATITGDMTMSAGQDRLRGYQEAMREACYPIQPEWIVVSDFGEQYGCQGMRQLLALPERERPTAVFTASDSMAIGAMQAIQEHNLTIPHDVAVVGFDDVPEAANTIPALTTIRQPAATLGEKAAEMLLHLIEGKDSSFESPLILSPQLIPRDST